MLEIQGLEKRFGAIEALHDLSFAVQRGEVFGFVGSNGAGKTTTMRAVMGVLEPDRGSIRWDGQPVSLDARRRFGYMPEERGLYPTMRLGDQIRYLAQLHGLSAADARRDAALWLGRLGLGGRLGDEVQKLSHGNQQRAQLAAALAFGPELLILDEPFAGLDPVAVDVMSGVLRERAAEGVAVLFSSHQLELVERLCDRVGIINAGSMVATGSIAQLAQSAEARLWVDAPGAGPLWPDLPGVTVERREGSRILLNLGPHPDDQAILASALATGPVREFRRDAPSLAELFRSVLSSGEERS